MNKNNYVVIAHTADFGVHVWGKDLPALFINAAKAMFAVIAEERKSVSTTATSSFNREAILIELTAKNLEDLLYAWLSHLNSLSDAKNVIFIDFDVVQLITADEEKFLTAKIYPDSKGNFEIKRDIKAVTYHGLKIGKNSKRYETDIIFDL